MKAIPTLQTVLESSAKRFGVIPTAVAGHGRQPHAVRARMTFFVAARELGFSYPEIADACSRRSHSSVADSIGHTRRRHPDLVEAAAEVIKHATQGTEAPNTINHDNTHLIRKINALSDRLMKVEEQLAASAADQ